MTDRAFVEFLRALPPDLHPPLVARRPEVEAALAAVTRKGSLAALADEEAMKTAKAVLALGLLLSAAAGSAFGAAAGSGFGWAAFFVSLAVAFVLASYEMNKEKRRILAGGEPL